MLVLNITNINNNSCLDYDKFDKIKLNTCWNFFWISIPYKKFVYRKLASILPLAAANYLFARYDLGSSVCLFY